MDFPITAYPTNAETDPNYLYRSLGSFWTQLFHDKQIVKAYTLGLAEEITQRYLDLIETINSYSVEDVPVFHREKWYPITMYKSQFDNAPLIFNPGDARFGPQTTPNGEMLTANDQYYQNVIFQFGFPKIPVADVFIYNVGEQLQDFGVICDQIINPSFIFTKGTDVILDAGILYFNQNIFNLPNLATVPVINENGEVATYTDRNGNTINEEMLILWAYQGMLDVDNIYNSFGYIFKLNQQSSEFYKQVIESVFELFVGGPTVRNIVSVCSAFMGFQSILSDSETIEEVFTDSLNKWVVSNKNVYKFELYHNILPSVIPGAVFNAGDILVDAIAYYDNVTAPTSWWNSDTVFGKKLALSQYLFVGNYENQLVFDNTIDLVTLDGNGYIHFPVTGTVDDKTTFNNYINSTKYQTANKKILGLVNPGDSVPINPADFIISNFLKNNMALIKFNFSTQELQASFLELLPLLKEQLPPYTYIVFDLALSITNELYDNLNGNTPITFNNPTGTLMLNADGSDSSGVIAKLAPYNYTNTNTRLFAISKAVPFDDTKYEYVVARGATDSMLAAAETAGRVVTVIDGAVYQQPTLGMSTAQMNKLQLINFL